jgi:hypothetical protein
LPKDTQLVFLIATSYPFDRNVTNCARKDLNKATYYVGYVKLIKVVKKTFYGKFGKLLKILTGGRCICISNF